jgi:hypothetical protein
MLGPYDYVITQGKPARTCTDVRCEKSREQQPSSEFHWRDLGNGVEAISVRCLRCLSREKDWFKIHVQRTDYEMRDKPKMSEEEALKNQLEKYRSSAITSIREERGRQRFTEGFSVERDDLYKEDELVQAAARYLLHGRGLASGIEDAWPWSETWWKPSYVRRNLVKAAALIVAEIERIDRLGASK